MGKKYLKSAALFAWVLMASFAVGISPVAASSLSTTTLVTVGNEGEGSNDSPEFGAVHSSSENGDITVFSSRASNLTADDTNGLSDVFVYDKTTSTTELISTNGDGDPANGGSLNPSVSADGRYVVYATGAKNIIPLSKIQCLGQSPCVSIIVHDRVTGQNSFANVGETGQRLRASIDVPPVISADGNFVAFQSSATISQDDNNNVGDILVRNLQAGETTLVSIDGDGATGAEPSTLPSISGDGRYVVFSTASPLIPEDENSVEDIYLRDRQTGTTTLVSTAQDGFAGNMGSYDPAISSDGSTVAFLSTAENIVADDTNEMTDVFSRNLLTSTTSRANVANDGTQANDESYDPGINGDGSSVVFSSSATNLVPDDVNDSQDVFIRDSGTTRQASVASHDGPAASGGDSYRPSISADGKAVAFLSEANNLYPASLNPGVPNLYLFYEPVETP